MERTALCSRCKDPWSHLTSVHMGEQENVHFLGQRWIFLDILLLCRLFRRGVLDLISKRTLKLKHFLFFFLFFVFQTLAAHFMQLQANSASQLWIFIFSVSRCSAVSQPSCCFATLSPQAAGGTITSSRLHNNI